MLGELGLFSISGAVAPPLLLAGGMVSDGVMGSAAPLAAMGGFVQLLLGNGMAFDCDTGSPILLVIMGLFGSLLG